MHKILLSHDAKNIIMANSETYTIAGQPSGACFLKMIIGKSMVDTIATVNVLQNSIANLQSKMKELKGDVKSLQPSCNSAAKFSYCTMRTSQRAHAQSVQRI
jgi:hypothetical protein